MKPTHDTCVCGNRKRIESLGCKECFLTRGSETPKKDLCSCGMPKLTRSKTCKACYEKNRPRGLQVHGDYSSYVNWKCRCEACKADYYAYLASWRERNPTYWLDRKVVGPSDQQTV